MGIEQKETLYLFWRNEEQKEFKIGELCKRTGKYYFKYNIEETKEALEHGFELLSGFPRIDAEYFKEELFRTFADNIPTKERKEIVNDEDNSDDFEVLVQMNDKNGFRFEVATIKEKEDRKEKVKKENKELKNKDIKEDKVKEEEEESLI